MCSSGIPSGEALRESHGESRDFPFEFVLSIFLKDFPLWFFYRMCSSGIPLGESSGEALRESHGESRRLSQGFLLRESSGESLGVPHGVHRFSFGFFSSRLFPKDFALRICSLMMFLWIFVLRICSLSIFLRIDSLGYFLKDFPLESPQESFWGSPMGSPQIFLLNLA